MKLWKINDQTVDEGDTFTYRVELFVLQGNRWNLENCKYYESDSYIDGTILSQIFKYDNFSIIKDITLVKAPLEWLKENAELIEIETKKEKSARLRLQNKGKCDKDNDS